MSIFWLIIGLLISYGSFEIGLGTPNSPGSGFFPFMSGVLIVGTATAILLINLNKKIKGLKTIEFFPSFQNFKKVLLLFLILIGYMFFLNILGVSLCTFLLMAIILKVVGSKKWVTVICGSLFTSIGFYIVFQLILKCQLPTGIIGF